ncbi:transglutaminase family protein [Luedemannella flava]|uniref:Transglutaminase family protein n=1 Tax=Luedemannella flava TaxID=349316 RepID=A0ABP4YZS7_9ACTN
MSWRLRIRHVTGFTYDGTAHASYNEARMTPVSMPGQNTLYSHVETHPAATTWRYRDYWGTQVTSFDLQRAHQQLRVTATSLVETMVAEVAPQRVEWATLRGEDVRDQHAELLVATKLTEVDDELAAEVDNLMAAEPADTALRTAEWVHDTVAYVPGSTGVQTGAQEAWALRKGVCQDLAHLTVGLLRARGIPARYVSGYLYPNRDAAVGDTVEGQSHAWVEWWCGEWFGYDPTNAVPAGHRHVVVARGRDYADVTPLKGVYHGAPAAHLGVTVEITRLA